MDHDLSQYIKGYVDKKKITHLNTFLLLNKNYLKLVHEIHSEGRPSSSSSSSIQLENVKSSDQENVIIEAAQSIMNLYKKTKISHVRKQRRKPYLALAGFDCSDNLIDNARKFNGIFNTPLDPDSRDLVYVANFHAHWMKPVCSVSVSSNIKLN